MRRIRGRRVEPYKWMALATFNSERARGIVHTPEWVAKMGREKLLFDEEMRRKITPDPFSPTPPPPPVELEPSSW